MIHNQWRRHMLRAFSTSATGMMAQETLVDVIANNLANVNTTGFKRSQIEFQDLLYAKMKEPGTEVAPGVNAPTGLEVGTGVRVSSTAAGLQSRGVPEHRAQPGHRHPRERIPAGAHAQRGHPLHARRVPADQRERPARDADRVPDRAVDFRSDGCGHDRYRQRRRRQRDGFQRRPLAWSARSNWPASSIPPA